MDQHDHRAQNREAAEPEEGTRAVPKIVIAWIAVLIVWGVGYYAWQIGKPMLGGDSRTPVAAEHQESKPAEVVSSVSSETAESADAASSEAPSTSNSVEPSTPDPESSDVASSEDSSPSNTANTASAEADGAAIFSAQCSACHQANGQGIPGAFPPLAGSEWLLGDPNIPIAIVHDGLQGEIEVTGKTFQGVMPPLGGQLSDAELAAVLSYARSEWGNNASEVSPDAVAKHKERFGDRGSWSAEELTEVFGEP